MQAQPKQSLTKRIGKYSLAAASATAATVSAQTVDADIVFLDLSGSPVIANSSLEKFVDIQDFSVGASAIAISVASSSASAANPLAPNSEFMIRGAGAGAQVRGNNGAAFGYYSAGGYRYLSNVGAVGNYGAAFDGTNNLTMYFDGYGGPFDIGTPGIAHFTFINTQDGGTYNGWLHLQTDGTAGNRQVTVTGITVDTLSAVPEPGSMGLLCLGAMGIAGYRRRRKAAD